MRRGLRWKEDLLNMALAWRAYNENMVFSSHGLEFQLVDVS